MERVWVKAGARLHLGQLDLNGSLSRLYGGLGLALDWPQIELFAEKQNSLYIKSPGEEKRLEKIARQYLEHYNLPGAALELRQTFPSHSGFGSGTQLALALGTAITKLYGLSVSPVELAMVTERENSRSGLGIGAFFEGGFMVDGGKALSGGIISGKAPPILVRLPFPEEWAVILAIPKSGQKVFGEVEVKAFRSLPPMEEQVSGRICRLLLMKLLPGLTEKNLDAFGQGIEEIQKHIGDYFAPVQGGRFACAQSERVAGCLSSVGLVGVGQSSWGPTVYGFCRREHRESLLEQVRAKVGLDVKVWAASGNNQGAQWGREGD